MADRTAAHAYGQAMTAFSKQKVLDKHFFRFVQEALGDYDFSPYQANADDALLSLGLIGKADRSPGNQMPPVSMKTAIRSIEKVFIRDWKEGDRNAAKKLARLHDYAKKYGAKVTLVALPATSSTVVTRRIPVPARTASAISLPTDDDLLTPAGKTAMWVLGALVAGIVVTAIASKSSTTT